MIRRLVTAAIVGEVVRRVMKAKPTRRKAKASTKSRRKRAKARARH
jgi:hypothetical protein